MHTTMITPDAGAFKSGGWLRALGFSLALFGVLLAVVASAAPAAAAPVLKVRSDHVPSVVPSGGTADFEVTLSNVGDAATNGPVTVSIELPPGLAAESVTDQIEQMFGVSVWSCSIAPGGASVSCQGPDFGGPIPLQPGQEACQSLENLTCRLLLTVSAATDAPGGTTEVQACGGGVPECAFDADPTPVGLTSGFGVNRFDGQLSNPDGSVVTQAGAHPYELTTEIKLNRSDGASDGTVKAIDVELPSGLVGDPGAAPPCPARVIADSERTGIPCPPDSQVGIAEVLISDELNRTPIFNVEPPPDVPARFGFVAEGVLVTLDASIRSGGDYGITVASRNINQTLQTQSVTTTFWGVPGDPRHDSQRGLCFVTPAADLCPAGTPPRPLLTTPTDCSAGPLETRALMSSWESPGTVHERAFFTHQPGRPSEVYGLTGCERLPFDPSIRVQPTNPTPDSPSGYEIEVRVPQNDNPDGLATAHLDRAVVTLPEGVTVNPSSADGLQACSPVQIGLRSSADPTCPEASKIGTVEVDTPLLEEPLMGHIYVARQSDNPFGTLLAIYVVAKGQGVIVKLAGRVDADPRTGRLTTTFDNNPQLPFTSFRLRFKGGPRAPLANPPTCGVKTVETSLTPYSAYPASPAPRVADPSRVAHPSASFMIDCPGLSGFAPGFNAGMVLPVGGRFSPFAVRIERSDRQQHMGGLTVEMPPGLVGSLRGIPLCSDALVNAGACPLESRVGTATVGAGAGPNPYFIQGSVSLTGPYKGAPYGLAVAVRAVAGPYDLGTVVVRQQIFIDRVDAHLTVVSDPFPTILEGIPLRLRSVNVDIDRPGFTLNPTSCRQKRITASLSSAEGAVHQVAQRFQVGDCQALRLRPRLALRLTGRRQTVDGRHPGVRAVLTQRRGQANMRKVAVKLPLSLALDPKRAQSNSLCEFEAGQRVDCPRSSIIGRARAITPLLNRPLKGPVYFVKNIRVDRRTGRRIRTLPTLLIPLRGEIAIDLRARTTVHRGKLVSTFDAIPDTPVSRFELSLAGGRRGILVVTSDNLCDRRQIADVDIDGHNGKRSDRAVTFRTPCRKKRARGGGPRRELQRQPGHGNG